MLYGLSCVMGNFGSGKTFHIFKECFEAGSNTYVIANVPYSRVDHFYSSVDDLLNVFEVLDDYTMTTNLNVKEYTRFQKQTKNILLIVDEAQLYLGARESLTKASILNKLKLIFTQCRKRKIRIVFITQRLTQIDIYVRRLADYVEEYHRSNFLGIYRVKKSVYENRGDVADIETDQTVKYTNEGEMKHYKDDAKLYSELSVPLTMGLQLFAFFSPAYRKMIKEYHQTNYVCGQFDARVIPLTKEKLIEGLYIKSPLKLPLKEIVKTNVPTFYKVWSSLVAFNNKIFAKIQNILHTSDETTSSKDLQISLPKNIETSLNDQKVQEIISSLKVELEKEEEINKKLTLKEKLALLHNIK